MKQTFLILMSFMLCISCAKKNQHAKNLNSTPMMIRISEIEIVPEFLDEYLSILKEESSASVKLEPGVICIYPMYQEENKTQIRILEIYADKIAYQSHLETSHFKHYKTATLKMIKSLKLIDMNAIDAETMPLIFKKQNKDLNKQQ